MSFCCCSENANGKVKIVKECAWFEFEDEIEPADEVAYEICGVVLHKGANTNQGHYVSVVKIAEEWWSFNDAKAVKLQTDKSGMQGTLHLSFDGKIANGKRRFGYLNSNFTPYLLFYSRKQQK